LSPRDSWLLRRRPLRRSSAITRLQSRCIRPLLLALETTLDLSTTQERAKRTFQIPNNEQQRWQRWCCPAATSCRGGATTTAQPVTASDPPSMMTTDVPVSSRTGVPLHGTARALLDRPADHEEANEKGNCVRPKGLGGTARPAAVRCRPHDRLALFSSWFLSTRRRQAVQDPSEHRFLPRTRLLYLPGRRKGPHETARTNIAVFHHRGAGPRSEAVRGAVGQLCL
jgi:hypothetical protein